MANEVGEIRAKLTLDAKNFKKGMNDAKDEIDSAKKKSQELRKEMTAIQTASSAVAFAVAGSIALAVKSAANFEQKLQDIKAVSGASNTEMQQLSDTILDLSKSSKYTADQVALGAEELLKAGISMSDVLGGELKGALDLAAAGTISLADAATIGSVVLNAFKDDGLGLSAASDILAGAANAAATDVLELNYGLAQVSAVASGVGMSFKDTATALALFSNNGLKGSDAGTSLKTMLSNLQPTTSAQIAQFKELNLMTENGANAFFTAEGSLRSLEEIAGVLRKSMGHMTDQQRMLTMEMIFGSDAIRAGNILYKEGAEGVSNLWREMSKVSAADVAKTKMDSLIGSFEEFKSSVSAIGIQVGNEFLPVFREIVEAGTDLVRKFGEMDSATVATGLKMVGAASGMALLLSTIGKISIALRALALSPVGLAITGISLLTGLVIGLKDGYARLNEVNLDAVNGMKKQHDALETSVTKYDDLKNRSRLTNDELARFVDINSEINRTANPEIIEALRLEQELLTEKSGLTNEELGLLIQLNDEIIQTVPGATTVITNQGNALLNGTEAAKKYNREQLEMIRLELKTQQVKAEANMNDLLIEEERLKKSINGLNTDRINLETEIANRERAIRDEVKKAEEARRNGQTEYAQLHEDNLINMKTELQLLKDQRVELYTKLSDKQTDLKLTQDELRKLDEITHKMVDIELAQAGINAKKGEGLQTVQNEIDKHKLAIRELDKTRDSQGRLNAEARIQIEEHQRQIDKLNGVKSKIEGILGTAGALNRELSRDISKTVTINERVRNQRMGGRADYHYHTGGIVGRGQMPKLHTGGFPKQFFDKPMHNEIDIRALPNEMLLTEAQQANLMRMIDAGLIGGKPQSAEPPNRDTSIQQSITINSARELSPSEIARKNKQALRELAMEWEAR
jgi:TP901 family phage tail tape measure protein